MEVMGQLLAAHNMLPLLVDERQLVEFAAHALLILPATSGAAVHLEGQGALEGNWDRPPWQDGDDGADSGRSWVKLDEESQLLALPVATRTRRHGHLWVRSDKPREIDPYLPFLANFASGLALILENKQHQREIDEATERVRASEARYSNLFRHMSAGFAVHEIITDSGGVPIDYRFLEMNPAFEGLTGLRAEKCTGRRARDVLPALEPYWVEAYGDVALRGRERRFENYSRDLDRHYEVIAYCPEPGKFATIFTDITERKRHELERQHFIEELQTQSEELQDQTVKLQDLYEAQRRIALTLQENFVHELPEVPGLELAVISEPAASAELIGGDFYDVFQLPDGRVIALIGDVMGKGIAAAGLTETVRSAVRALAMVSPRPDLVLEQTNRLLVAERHTQFVTALLVLLDPKTGEGLLASAGHPPALRASRGVVGSVEVPYGTPLGAFADRPYAAAAFSLSPGEVLILYTDGLSEARRKGVLLGEDGLRELVRELEPRPRVIVEGLRQGALAYAGVLRDDLQILAIARPMPQHQPCDGNDRSEPCISEHH